VDERLHRFLRNHAIDVVEEVERDVAPYRDLSLEERGRILEAVCRDSAAILASRPDRDRVLDQVDPPHPSYRAIIRRLAVNRRAGGRG
jgi:hypothetical protein